MNWNSKKIKQVRIRAWLLWSAAFVLILSLATTAFILHMRLATLAPGDESIDGLRRYNLGVGFWGLVGLFVLYTIWKQIQLNSLRDIIIRDEQELQSLRAHFDEVIDLFRVAFFHDGRLSMASMFDIITHRCVDALRAQHASIMLLDESGEFLVTQSSNGVGREFARDARQRVGQGIGGRVVSEGKAILLPEDDETIGDNSHPHRRITSAISVPIKAGEVCVGVLNVNRVNFPDPFTRQQVEVLAAFACHVGTMLDAAKQVDDLRTRSEDLEQEKLRLEEFNKVKDVFLSTASHELKTPLTAVIGYAELLCQTDMSVPEQQEFLNGLQAEATRLLGLIDNILDLTRLETGKTPLRLEPISFDELIQSAVQTVTPMAAKQDLSIDESYGAGDIRLNLDEVQMRQVLVNLLTNAIRYSPSGQAIRVESRIVPDGFKVSITDRGPGIEDQEQEHIFTMFGQGLRKDAGNTHGLGIGLHLVQRIVALHGGAVQLQSSTQPGEEGSTFSVLLPLDMLATGEVSIAA